jgi:geranylgeranyl pyrophosphate synthase
MNTASFLDVISDDLERVEATLQVVSRTDYPLLATILNGLFASGGKRLRPALVFLSAHFGRCEPELLTPLAAAVELLHTATLVHDDLIDNSLLRRGSPTMNTIWQGSIVVLVGDYLFAKAAELASQTDSVPAGKLFARTLAIICDGELRQAFTARSWQQTEEEYYRKICAKTASLFAASTEAGAILSQQSAEAQSLLREYGHNLGMAFQVVDDILDFVGEERQLGKPVGSDLRQGTITLPAIYYQQAYPQDEVLRSALAGEQREELLARAIQAIRESPAIERSYAAARSFIDKARSALTGFPDNSYHRALLGLADYAVERKK